MKQAERQALRRVDDLHRLATKVPTVTALWLFRQSLAEAEDAYFRSGHPDDLALVVAIEATLTPRP